MPRSILSIFTEPDGSHTSHREHGNHAPDADIYYKPCACCKQGHFFGLRPPNDGTGRRSVGPLGASYGPLQEDLAHEQVNQWLETGAITDRTATILHPQIESLHPRLIVMSDKTRAQLEQEQRSHYQMFMASIEAARARLRCRPRWFNFLFGRNS